MSTAKTQDSNVKNSLENDLEGKLEGKKEIITASSSRLQAMMFNIGNVISMLPGAIVAPYALMGDMEKLTLIVMMLFMIVPPILWFGISIITYALTKHHPNEKVGHYVQHAAYRFYGLFGSIIPIGTFYGTDWRLWIVTGGVISAIILPWSFWDLYKIYKDDWQDMELVVPVRRKPGTQPKNT